MKKPERTERVELRLSKYEKRRWVDAANKIGISLADYIRLTIEQAQESK